jgi:hypothetical protein
LASQAFADAPVPTPTRLSVRGLTAGGTTTLVVDGTNLESNPRLLLSVPIARQEAKALTKKQTQFDVTLPADVPPGIHQLWVVTDAGISQPMDVAIDTLPELPLGEKIEKLPVALNAFVQSRDVLRTTFTGKAHETIVIDVEARRLGSTLNPIVRLNDARGIQLAWSQGQDSIFGDARIVTELPADGLYTIELHDALFSGRGHLRLKVGKLEYADLAFPLAAKLDDSLPLGFVSSNFPAGTAVVAHATRVGTMPAPWPSLSNLTGARPRLLVTDMDELVEQSSAGAMQQLKVPSGVTGRLAEPGEEDRYELLVSPKSKVRVEIMANRLGSPVDGVLLVRTKAGAMIATSDDQSGTPDPGLQFTAPDKDNSVIVSIKDLTGRGGADYVYHLSASPVGAADFALSVLDDNISVPIDGVAVVKVRAMRTGYNNAIQLALDPMPAGVTLTGTEIPAGATDTLLAIHTGEHKLESLLANLVGESTGLKPNLRRAAQTPERPSSKVQPWLRDELPVVVTRGAPVTVAFESTSSEKSLPLGSAAELKVKVDRAKGTKGPVRVSLVTSQVPPKKKIPQKDNRKRPLPDLIVDDVDRTLRFKLGEKENGITIDADKNGALATLLVPGDLPDLLYDVALKAELLSADGKQVLAESFSPVERLRPMYPFAVELAGKAAIEAKAGGGESDSLTGRVVRKAGFSGPVTVTLRGLPPEVAPPMVEVPAGKDDFKLAVSFPFHTAKGDMKGIKLAAETKGPYGLIQSNEVAVAVKVISGDPPQGPYRIFDDEPAFLSYLTEGDGEVKLFTDDKFAGAASMFVKPELGRLKMPGLNIKITEKPKPGEYRYLRFAWKANGGHNILLRLYPNKEALGSDSKKVFGYESGDAGNKVRLSVLRVSEKMPTDWTVVTRDLYKDFGEFTLEGIGFSPVRSVGYPEEKDEYGLYDQIYLGRSMDDFRALDGK